ncbi:MAG: hypothetical protein RL226_776 [Bacteroidota bacterium]|jgi:FKBP-type peptidyl-prolyl cis-trans isomerase SlyD
MKIEKGTLVVLDYSLYENGPDGELIEETSAEEPFEFIYGHEEMLPKFEAAILGKAAGEQFSVAIAAEEAYGLEDPEAIVEFEKSMFMVDGELDDELFEEGEYIPMEDEEGNEVLGIVTEVGLNHVTLDFNHPLAGIDLYFDGEIKEVRQATQADFDRLVNLN